MNVLAIDPGTDESAYVSLKFYETTGKWEIYSHGIETNEMMRRILQGQGFDWCVCEMIASYGMPVGAEVFATCLWIGRFQEILNGKMQLIERRHIKLHFCDSARAKDPNIRQALINRFGKPGTKKEPGFTYGIKTHLWAALALAVYAIDVRVECKNTLGKVIGYR